MIGWLFQQAKYPQYNAEVIKIIRKHSNQIHQLTDSRGCSLLHILAEFDNFALLGQMLELYDQHNAEFTKADWLNLTDNQGNTPLHYAAFKGSLRIVQLLQNNGVNSMAINKNGLNCLHFAAQGGSPLIMYYFKEKGISVDCVDHNSNTPLHWAVYAGSDCSVTALLCWGAAADLQEHNGDTPLHLAVMFGRMKAISMLVTYGCDVTIKNKDNLTAFELAVQHGYENIESYLLPKQPNCIARLLCRVSSLKNHNFKVSMLVLLLSVIINAVSFYVYSATQLYGLFITCIVLSVGCLILFVALHNSDAGSIYSFGYDKDAYMRLLSQNDPKSICFQCHIKKPVRSKHCYECGRCIRVFDHHCSWVGNCIGTNNIFLFIILLLECLLYIVFTLISHTVSLATALKQGDGALRTGMLVCSTISVVLSVLTVVPIFYLLVRHTRLSMRGITFYEHYKLKKASHSNKDIMLQEMRKLVTGRSQVMHKARSASQGSSSTQRHPLMDKAIEAREHVQQRGCCQQARWILFRNKYLEQYGWKQQPLP